MHNILEIALGVALGMTIFLVILWILGMCVYVCCGNSKKIATVRKMKSYDVKSIKTPVLPSETKTEELAQNSEAVEKAEAVETVKQD